MTGGDDKTIVKPRPGQGAKAPASSNNDRTIIKPKPRPGGGGDSTVIKPKSSRPAAVLAQASANSLATDSPLIDASTPILSLVIQLKQLDGKVNASAVHKHVVDMMRKFQQAAKSGIDDGDIRNKASYVLCSLIDETVLNTNWGEHSAWSQKPLLSVFHDETYGGEKVYDMLEEAIVLPSKNYELIELIYYSFSLGFMGKLRVDPQGPAKSDQVRSNVYDVLHRSRERHHKVLSANIDPAVSFGNKLYSFLPVWIICALLILGGFSIFNYWLIDLNKRSDIASVELSQIIPPVKRVLLTGDELRSSTLTLRKLLAPEIARGVVSVDEYVRYTSVTLHSEELFAPGSIEVDIAFQPVLDKIAKALERIPGGVSVTGHTDNKPIRTVRFPSNFHLSLARASAVVKYMDRVASLDARLLPEGKGESEPIDDNSTIAGRAKNRRVVIDIYHQDK